MGALIFIALLIGFAWLIFKDSTSDGFKVIGLMAGIAVTFVIVLGLFFFVGVMISG